MTANDWTKVHAALKDPRWDFRTVEGIAKETALEPDLIIRVLEAHRSDIRQTISRDRRTIYTLKSRPKKMREVIADIQTFASNSL